MPHVASYVRIHKYPYHIAALSNSDDQYFTYRVLVSILSLQIWRVQLSSELHTAHQVLHFMLMWSIATNPTVAPYPKILRQFKTFNSVLWIHSYNLLIESIGSYVIHGINDEMCCSSTCLSWWIVWWAWGNLTSYRWSDCMVQ